MLRDAFEILSGFFVALGGGSFKAGAGLLFVARHIESHAKGVEGTGVMLHRLQHVESLGITLFAQQL